ncbi:MAG: YgiT-type zinc finger protein [Chloroflexi bacterium]|nr:YgiT-type zinc finger protein [Chloroflexota bacterium]
MICEFCGSETIEKKVKRLHWFNKKLYIVENVPARVCAECGERYFHAEVLDEIDHMLDEDHEVMERIEVEVVAL